MGVFITNGKCHSTLSGNASPLRDEADKQQKKANKRLQSTLTERNEKFFATSKKPSLNSGDNSKSSFEYQNEYDTTLSSTSFLSKAKKKKDKKKIKKKDKKRKNLDGFLGYVIKRKYDKIFSKKRLTKQNVCDIMYRS